MSLIDDLMQGLTRGVGEVKVRSQELMQAYNLQQEMKELERKKTAKFVEIGRLIYDKYERQDNLDEEVFKERVREIVIIEKDLVQLQAELDSLQAQSDPNIPASKKADVKAGYTATPGISCPKCHAPANKEKSFCPTCGEPLKQTNSQTEIDNQTEQDSP